MNSPSRPLVRVASVAERIRRDLLAEVEIALRVADDRTTFAPHGTY
jgi:hypothetical protein